jgi:hypothetical protein
MKYRFGFNLKKKDPPPEPEKDCKVIITTLEPFKDGDEMIINGERYKCVRLINTKED